MPASASLPRSEIEFALDRPNAVSVGGGTYVFSGWCFALRNDKRLEVELVAGKSRIPAYVGLPRPDVARHYPHRAAAKSGYVVRFHCPDSIQSVSVVARLDGAELVMFSNLPVLLEAEVAQPAARLAYNPLLSVVLFESDSQPYFQKRSVESVREQTYKNWEFGLGGEFVVLLDQNDELHPSALLEIARAINRFPHADLFYSDAEPMDRVGVPSGLISNPDFEEDVLLSSPGMGNLVAVRRSLLPEHLTSGWDTFIRVSERLNPESIQHIRKPLCRRRIRPEITSAQILKDHIQRTGKKAEVARGLLAGSLRLKYDAPREIELGVFIRPEDGPFQASIVQVTAGRRKVHLNEAGDVCVYITGRLDSLNHLFFEELIGAAMRPECGVVMGEGFSARRREHVGATGLRVLQAPYSVAVFDGKSS